MCCSRTRSTASVTRWSTPTSRKRTAATIAYGLYVLARNGAAPIGDLRYLADTKLSNLATPIAKSQLAAALALVGDKARAERVYRGAGCAGAEACARVRPHRLRLRRCAMRRLWSRSPAKATRRGRR